MKLVMVCVVVGGSIDAGAGVGAGRRKVRMQTNHHTTREVSLIKLLHVYVCAYGL